MPLRQPKVAVLTYQPPGLTDAPSAEAVVEIQAAAAVPEVAVSTRHSKRQRVQQSIVSLMPQSKAGQAAAVSKLSSKPGTSSQNVETVKAVGLASQGRCIRRKVVQNVM